jgi:hypothetical protein
MNRKAFKKNEWKLVKIRPVAKRFYGETGPPLPPVDDDWLITWAGDDGVRINNIHTDHGTLLAWDQVHHFNSDPVRGSGFGTLILNVQLHIGGDQVWSEPAPRPGESIPDQFDGVRGWRRENDSAYVQATYPVTRRLHRGPRRSPLA